MNIHVDLTKNIQVIGGSREDHLDIDCDEILLDDQGALHIRDRDVTMMVLDRDDWYGIRIHESTQPDSPSDAEKAAREFYGGQTS